MSHSSFRFWLLVSLVLGAGCECDVPPDTVDVQGGFLVEPEEVVDFGRVLEGEVVRRTVRLTGKRSTAVTVHASVFHPSSFWLEETEVQVPRGGSATLEVFFRAGAFAEASTLTLTSEAQEEEVRLVGEGVRPWPCLPSGPCNASRFVLEVNGCVESPLPEGTACIPSSRCQENGRCQGGECVGSPRTCDDGNPCTQDTCSPEQGCVNPRVACPEPSNPCRAGYCDRERGCGEVDAPDLTRCGKVDCRTSRLCVSGTCQEVPTPEGFLCAPATPCQEEGHCSGGACVRPDAGVLQPDFSMELGGEPVAEPGGPVLLVHGGALYASVCGGDAGCRLVSFTDNGLLRFESPYPEGGARTLLAVSDAGVVLREPGALEAYAPVSPGASLWRLPLASLPTRSDQEAFVPGTGAGQVALGPAGEVVALVTRELPDGGLDAGVERKAALVRLAPDGSLESVAQLPGFLAPARVALGAGGAVWLQSAGGPLLRAESGDGGTRFLPVLPDGGSLDGGASLAVAGGWLLSGARHFVSLYAGDAGPPVPVDWDAGTRGMRPLDEPVLLRGETGYAFARTCLGVDATPCTLEEEGLVLRALEARGGTVRWEAPVLPDGPPGVLHEAALVSLGGGAWGSGVGAITSVRLDAGTHAQVQVFAEGSPLAVCPLPGMPRVAGAVFVGSFVYIALEREGTWWLEAFDLGTLVQAESGGWPQRHGVSGTRRAGP
jgi:hypothetical protein